jgi:hypothetical protein
MSKIPESKFKSFFAARKDLAEDGSSTMEDSPLDTSAQRGRPSGKRSDPSFEQVTAYIRRRTHDAVKMRLLKEGQRRQFSELGEDLLAIWVRENV